MEDGKEVKEGLEVREEGEKNNPYGKLTEFEKRLIEKTSGEKLDDEPEEEEAEESEETEEAEEAESEEEAGEEEEPTKAKQEKAPEADKERKEKMRKDLEDALYSSPIEEVMSKDEADMTETEKQLAAQLRAERIKNARREENDILVKLLDPYTAEEQAVLVPEIKKFLRDEAYKALSTLPAAKRAAFALNHARGLMADKLQATAEERGIMKTEAKRNIEALASGPKKKVRKIDSSKKETLALYKAAQAGDRRAAQKLAGKNDPVLDNLIKRSGG